MDYSESLAYLGQIQEDGAKFSLENIQIVIDHFPFDLRKIAFIQVGGTNGKGSTAHGIASVLEQGGHRVGLFTSPHLFDPRERIAINKEWIPQAAFAQCLSMVRELTSDLEQKKLIPAKPSFFEHMLLVALFYFQHEQVDCAVLEVGLGGRLDATTAIRPCLTVITNVNYDHMKILGSTLSEIAQEKAGIIKAAVPMVCACKPGTAGYRIIRQRCLDLGAPFEPVFSGQNRLMTEDGSATRPSYRYISAGTEYRFTPGMNGRHQSDNAATIIRAAEILNRLGISKLDKEAIVSGIRKNQVPGRLEWFASKPPILIDGGHNKAGIKSLAAYLSDMGLKELTLVFGVLKDKQYRGMIREILPYARRVILTDPLSHRTKPAAQLSRYFAPLPVTVQPDPEKALHLALAHSDPILITGSLYLIGFIRDRILAMLHHTSMEV